MCDRCELLKRTLGEVRDHAKQWDIPRNEKIIIENKIERAEHDIMNMKRHQLRTVQKAFEHNEIIAALAQDEAFITLDFAMKWEPRKGRERESDFFGKRGYLSFQFNIPFLQFKIFTESVGILHMFCTKRKTTSYTIKRMFMCLTKTVRYGRITNATMRMEIQNFLNKTILGR